MPTTYTIRDIDAYMTSGINKMVANKRLSVANLPAAIDRANNMLSWLQDQPEALRTGDSLSAVCTQIVIKFRSATGV